MTPAPVRFRRRELRSASPGSPFVELPRHHFTWRKGALRSGSRSPVLDTALGDGRACELTSPQSWPEMSKVRPPSKCVGHPIVRS